MFCYVTNLGKWLIWSASKIAYLCVCLANIERESISHQIKSNGRFLIPVSVLTCSHKNMAACDADALLHLLTIFWIWDTTKYLRSFYYNMAASTASETAIRTKGGRTLPVKRPRSNEFRKTQPDKRSEPHFKTFSGRISRQSRAAKAAIWRFDTEIGNRTFKQLKAEIESFKSSVIKDATRVVHPSGLSADEYESTSILLSCN